VTASIAIADDDDQPDSDLYNRLVGRLLDSVSALRTVATLAADSPAAHSPLPSIEKLRDAVVLVERAVALFG
jgi:hypothetical protein